MNISFEEIWIYVLVGAPGIAAVIAFGVQAHALRRASLEHQKLQLEVEKLKSELAERDSAQEKVTLEIQSLRRELEAAESRIAVATPAEALHLTKVLRALAREVGTLDRPAFFRRSVAPPRTVQSAPPPPHDPPEEIDIPAFLRRQDE